MMRQWIAVHKPVEGTFSANFVTSFRPFCKSDIRKASATKIQKGLGTNGGKAIIRGNKGRSSSSSAICLMFFLRYSPMVSFSLYFTRAFPEPKLSRIVFSKSRKEGGLSPGFNLLSLHMCGVKMELFFLSECAVLGFGLCRFASLALKKGNL